MGVPALQTRFEELYGFPTTQKRVVTLRKRIAFRIQELYYGGLTSAEKDVLNEVASNDPLANLQRTSIRFASRIEIDKDLEGQRV